MVGFITTPTHRHFVLSPVSLAFRGQSRLQGLSREYSVKKAVLMSGQIVELMYSDITNECCCYVLFTVIRNSTSVT